MKNIVSFLVGWVHEARWRHMVLQNARNINSHLLKKFWLPPKLIIEKKMLVPTFEIVDYFVLVKRNRPLLRENRPFSRKIFGHSVIFEGFEKCLYGQRGARRSAAQAITHRLLSFCKEIKITANQKRVFNRRN
jgi:hypothetical protein